MSRPLVFTVIRGVLVVCLRVNQPVFVSEFAIVASETRNFRARLRERIDRARLRAQSRIRTALTRTLSVYGHHSS